MAPTRAINRGAMAGAVRIEGIDEAIRNFRIMSSAFGRDGEKLRRILLHGAELIRDDARSRAPYKTGLLYRGIRAGEITRKGPPAAFAAVDYRIAPHAHFFELGTRYMPAKPFFRPAVDANKDAILGSLVKRSSDLIHEAARNLPQDLNRRLIAG